MNPGIATDVHPESAHRRQLEAYLSTPSELLPEPNRRRLTALDKAIQILTESEITPAMKLLGKDEDLLAQLNEQYQKILLAAGGEEPSELMIGIRFREDRIAAGSKLLDEKSREREKIVSDRNRLAAESERIQEHNRVSREVDAAKAETLQLVAEIKDRLDRLRGLSMKLGYSRIESAESNRTRLNNAFFNLAEYFRLQVLEYVRYDFIAFLRAKNWLGGN